MPLVVQAKRYSHLLGQFVEQLSPILRPYDLLNGALPVTLSATTLHEQKEDTRNALQFGGYRNIRCDSSYDKVLPCVSIAYDICGDRPVGFIELKECLT